MKQELRLELKQSKLKCADCIYCSHYNSEFVYCDHMAVGGPIGISEFFPRLCRYYCQEK